MTKNETARIVAMLQAAYPNATWPDEIGPTIDMWHLAWKDIPLPWMLRAVEAFVVKATFRPSPAELRRWVAENTGAIPDPEYAWAQVEVARGAFNPDLLGSSGNEFDSSRYYGAPVREVVGLLGGLRLLKVSPRPDRDREQFLSLYKNVADHYLIVPGFAFFAVDDATGEALMDGDEPKAVQP